MSIFELFLLAVGLSMDACAVSMTNGMCYSNINKKTALGIAASFGFFQALMPVVGFLCGTLFIDYIENFDHWIAFSLLGFLGVRMVVSGIRSGHDSCPVERTLTIKNLFMQSIATSVDALAVGISLAAVKVSIHISATIIGITTFALCLPAVLLGKKTGAFLSGKAEIIGGLILLGIGTRILISHL